MPQRPVLVGGTVADNVPRLARPDAPDEEVAAAARAAALDVPLTETVGEDGAGLSTGQQRRVALARAVLADRPLLLLDEPTEGVDADTEAAILTALPEVVAGHTALVVSHRPAVLAACDRVIDLPTAAPHPTGAGRLTNSAPRPTDAAAGFTSSAPRPTDAAGGRSRGPAGGSAWRGGCGRGWRSPSRSAPPRWAAGSRSPPRRPG